VIREEKRVLKNGIEMYSYKSPGTHSFYISLYVRCGIMYESERESGISHFLEHVIIRNVNALMGGELYATLDRCGMEFNASTYSEMVQFYVSGATKHFSTATGIIEKVLSPIILSAAEVSAERQRIKAEMRENDERGSLSNFSAAIVHKGTPLARPITGSIGSVNSITRSRLEEYRKRSFTKENIFLYVSGSFSDEDLGLLSETLGGAVLSFGEIHTNVAPVSQNFGKREPKIYVKRADYNMLRFTFDMDMTRISSTEADLLYEVLLGGYNSRMFIEMSEKRGMFYDISGSTEIYRNVGSFIFHFELSSGEVTEAVRAVFDILNEIKTTPLPEEKCMKAVFVDNAGMLLDDPRELNFTFAYDNHILTPTYGDIRERAALYSAVTPKRITEVARLVFRPENLTLTMKSRSKKLDTDAICALIRSFGRESLKEEKQNEKERK